MKNEKKHLSRRRELNHATSSVWRANGHLVEHNDSLNGLACSSNPWIDRGNECLSLLCPQRSCCERRQIRGGLRSMQLRAATQTRFESHRSCNRSRLCSQQSRNSLPSSGSLDSVQSSGTGEMRAQIVTAGSGLRITHLLRSQADDQAAQV